MMVVVTEAPGIPEESQEESEVKRENKKKELSGLFSLIHTHLQRMCFDYRFDCL